MKRNQGLTRDEIRRLTTVKRTLEELKQIIKREVPFVDDKPYSHTLISLVLMQISLKYGKDEANKCIKEFELEELGWNKVE